VGLRTLRYLVVQFIEAFDKSEYKSLSNAIIPLKHELTIEEMRERTSNL
jgi:hypothetical protein